MRATEVETIEGQRLPLWRVSIQYARALSSGMSGAAMVGRRGIGDWYADAEGRGSDDPRYDWENDDRPDSTSDSWLDRVSSRVRDVPAKTRAASHPRANQSAPQAPRSSSARSGGPLLRNVAEAAHNLRAKDRNLSDEMIAERLRQRGWASVTQAYVREALERYPSRRSLESRSTTSAAGAAGSRQPDVAQVASSRADGSPISEFAAAVHALRVRMPELGIKGLARSLRNSGWPQCTRAQVRAVLQPTPSGASRTRAAAPVSRGPSRQLLPAPARRAAAVSAAEMCPSCGVRVSALGWCRCT